MDGYIYKALALALIGIAKSYEGMNQWSSGFGSFWIRVCIGESQDLYISYIYPGVVGVWIGREKKAPHCYVLLLYSNFWFKNSVIVKQYRPRAMK